MCDVRQAAFLLLAILPNLETLRLVDMFHGTWDRHFKNLRKLLRAALSEQHNITGINFFSKKPFLCPSCKGNVTFANSLFFLLPLEIRCLSIIQRLRKIYMNIGERLLRTPSKGLTGKPPPTFTLPTLQHLAYIQVMYETKISELHPESRGNYTNRDLKSNIDEFNEEIELTDDAINAKGKHSFH